MAGFIEDFISTGAGEDYRKLDDLQQNTSYKIKSFQLKKTTFGDALEIEAEDPETNSTFYCFLPDRFARKVKGEKDLKELNDKKFRFVFKGRVDKVAILEFIVTT